MAKKYIVICYGILSEFHGRVPTVHKFPVRAIEVVWGSRFQDARSEFLRVAPTMGMHMMLG